jgi:hypothetical protein
LEGGLGGLLKRLCIHITIYFRDNYWRPGEALPLHLSTPNDNYSQPMDHLDQSGRDNIMDTLQSMQTTMQKQFDFVSTQLKSITSRIDDIESKQASPNKQTNIAKTATTKRNRATPTSLQVCLCIILISE